MKPKILFIDDEESAIKIVRNRLKEDYDIIPEEHEVKTMQDKITYGEIKDFVKEKIQKYYNNIRLIICDLELRKEDYGSGAKLIEFIRKDLDIPQKPFLPRAIPVIVLTKYYDKTYVEPALNNGATHFINKKDIDKVFFEPIVKSMIRYYTRIYLERDPYDLKYNLNDILQELKKINESILIVQDNQGEILQKFDLLFRFQFSSLNPDKQDKIFNSFKKELSDILKQKEIDKVINKNKWKEIKEAIKDINKGGGFKVFVDTTYEILKETGILNDIPGGNIIGIAIKGIFGILSSASST